MFGCSHFKTLQGRAADATANQTQPMYKRPSMPANKQQYNTQYKKSIFVLKDWHMNNSWVDLIYFKRHHENKKGQFVEKL